MQVRCKLSALEMILIRYAIFVFKLPIVSNRIATYHPSDPHAGNLLAMPNGKLCYLDFGMISYLEASQRYAFIEAVIHLVNRYAGACCRFNV
jgi:ABC1 atypical kinase-like domain